jgi:hypothetical protein
MESTVSYKHKPLPSRQSIRLLKLHSSPSRKLSCSLFTASLDKLPQYEALSYAWDAQQPTEAISCEGRVLKVTQNCAAALRRFKNLLNDRVLWIDSICIDQESVEERNHQVKLMGDIYRGAKQVLVWVGEGNERTELLIKYLRAISGRLVIKSVTGKEDSAKKRIDSYVAQLEGTRKPAGLLLHLTLHSQSREATVPESAHLCFGADNA